MGCFACECAEFANDVVADTPCAERRRCWLYVQLTTKRSVDASRRQRAISSIEPLRDGSRGTLVRSELPLRSFQIILLRTKCPLVSGSERPNTTR